MPNDQQRITWIASLGDAGFSDQIVVSHDIYTKHRLRSFGGHGYDHLLVNIQPRMRQLGIAESALEAIFEKTPARLLTLS
jgi:phosphotriesterase-related protein